MIIFRLVQRPLSPLVYALDVKSRAFWFFIFTDEKGTPVKIGTTYSLCLKDKKKVKEKKGKQSHSRWTRPSGISLSRARRSLSRKGGPRSRTRTAAPFVYICTKHDRYTAKRERLSEVSRGNEMGRGGGKKRKKRHHCASSYSGRTPPRIEIPLSHRRHAPSI